MSSIAGVLASERTAIFCRKDLKKGADDRTVPMGHLEPGECSGYSGRGEIRRGGERGISLDLMGNIQIEGDNKYSMHKGVKSMWWCTTPGGRRLPKGYPAHFQKDGEERSLREAKESAIASQDKGDIFNRTRMVCESELTTYRWVGDREDGFDRFEFEFKRSGVCVLNITDLKKRLDPILLVAVLQINVIVKVSHWFESIRDESERSVMNEDCCRYARKHAKPFRTILPQNNKRHMISDRELDWEGSNGNNHHSWSPLATAILNFCFLSN